MNKIHLFQLAVLFRNRVSTSLKTPRVFYVVEAPDLLSKSLDMPLSFMVLRT
nr:MULTISPECIES: hypothetical protein [unclassified Allomuricauda]